MECEGKKITPGGGDVAMNDEVKVWDGGVTIKY